MNNCYSVCTEMVLIVQKYNLVCFKINSSKLIVQCTFFLSSIFSFALLVATSSYTASACCCWWEDEVDLELCKLWD